MRLQERGYEVVVLTTTPHFNIVPEQMEKQPMRWKVWGLCKVSDYHGMRVLHVPQKKFKSTALRMLGFVYWHFVSFFIGLGIRHVGLILSPSPPLTIGLLNLWLARLKGCKVVYNVQEIYPDILKLKGGMALKVLRWMERKVRLHIIPNFVDTELYRQVEWKGRLDAALFPETDSIKVLYAGNIGHAQSWEPLIELADRTRELNVEYIVIGEGAKRDYVASEIEKRGLEKLHLLPYQPRDLMPAILSYSDASFIFMAPESDTDGFPSKVYTIMACERPLLVLSGENTPIVNFLKDKGCAKLITEQDFGKKVDKMVAWLGSVTREELKEMGRKGLAEIEAKYTKEKVTDMYVELVDTLTK